MKIIYSKIYDVNDIKPGGDFNAGDDMFVPKMCEAYLAELFKRNSNLELKNKKDDLTYIEFFDSAVGMVAIYDRGKYIINKPICLPTGIQFVVPANHYFELRNRSSNFGNNFDIKTGIIDESYTFCCGFQLTPIDFSKSVIIDENTRIAQIVLLPKVRRMLNNIPVVEFEELNTVQIRRGERDGGFGSTGNK